MYKVTVHTNPASPASSAMELLMLQLISGSLTARAALRPRATISPQEQGASPLQRALAQIIIATGTPGLGGEDSYCSLKPRDTCTAFSL